MQYSNFRDDVRGTDLYGVRYRFRVFFASSIEILMIGHKVREI